MGTRKAAQILAGCPALALGMQNFAEDLNSLEEGKEEESRRRSSRTQKGMPSGFP
jgi:hypothetical protein